MVAMLLLDSHVVLWVLGDNPRLGAQARAAISVDSPVHVSAASVFELTLKAMLNKLTLPDDFERMLAGQGFAFLAITTSHAHALRRFPDMVGRDPFDQLLMAQASVEGMQLLTADRVLLATGHPFVVDATR